MIDDNIKLLTLHDNIRHLNTNINDIRKWIDETTDNDFRKKTLIQLVLTPYMNAYKKIENELDEEMKKYCGATGPNQISRFTDYMEIDGGNCYIYRPGLTGPKM